MRIVFMGTPDFAAQALQAIVEAGHEVTLVVTQPDKPKGRSGQTQPSPVKICAEKYGISVFQPVKVRAPEAVAELKKYDADICVVAAFGQILSREILELRKYGCVNIHASLLPKYRGSAPANQCIIDGEHKTGVTIMQMDEGVDTGDILTQKTIVLDEKETTGSLLEKLSRAGAELIVETLPMIAEGKITPQKQQEDKSSYVRRIEKSFGRIDWTKDAVQIERLVRGLNPWPSAYTTANAKILKLWQCDVVSTEEISVEKPGTIVMVSKDFFDVACGKGTLRIRELQIEGKKRMDAKSFLLGNPWKEGMCLGE